MLVQLTLKPANKGLGRFHGILNCLKGHASDLQSHHNRNKDANFLMILRPFV